MKRTFAILIPVMLALLLFPNIARSKSVPVPKIGVVDIEKVYQAYKKAKKTRKLLEAERKKKQKELEKKQKELNKLKDEYKKKRGSLSSSERASYEKKISQKEKELNEFFQKTNVYLMGKAKMLIGKRADEIENAIKEYGKKHGFTVILDKKTLPYFSNSVDVTNDVIKMLNKGD